MSSASTLLPLLAAALMHFYRFCGKNPRLPLLFSPLDLHERNGPLRETLVTDISLAFAQSSTPCLVYQCQQAEAASHPLHQGTFR